MGISTLPNIFIMPAFSTSFLFNIFGLACTREKDLPMTHTNTSASILDQGHTKTFLQHFIFYQIVKASYTDLVFMFLLYLLPWILLLSLYLICKPPLVIVGRKTGKNSLATNNTQYLIPCPLNITSIECKWST